MNWQLWIVGYDRDRLKADYEKELERWMDAATKDNSSVKPGVMATGTPMRADYFEKLGFGNGFDGIVWMQKEIDVPAEMAGQPLRLSLGAIDDEDVTYLNGVEVARGSV